MIYEDTQPLTIRHSNIAFNPFGVDPKKTTIFATDPWGVIRGKINEDLQKLKSKSKKRTQLTNALYYIKQGEQFYISAKNTPLLPKTTLLYYSIMNTAKCLNSINGYDAGSHHGLSVSYSQNQKANLKILSSKEKNLEMTFENFCKILKCNFNKEKQYNFKEMTNHLIELHNLKHSLEGLRLSYLPISIEPREFMSRGVKKYALFYSVNNKHEVIHNKATITSKFVNKLKLTTVKNKDNPNYTFYKDTNTTLDYSKLGKQLLKRQNTLRSHNIIASIVTNHGFKYYAYLKDRNYNHLSYIYMTFFLLSHVARYNPLIAESFLKGKNYAILSELTNLCPNQFVYQIANLIVGTEILADKFRI